MGESPLREASGDLYLHVWVVPGSSRRGLAGTHGDKLKLRVASPPEDGRANREVKEQLESTLGMDVELVRGMSSRHKVFKVAATADDARSVRRKLGLAE